MENNIHPHQFQIDRSQRAQLMGHEAVVIWFTGLSGSGKSTIADLLERQLFEAGIHTANLDGDNLRTGLNKDLGFSNEDRKENLRRIGEVAHLFVNSGLIVLAAFVSPFENDRQLVRQIIGDNQFIEIFINTPLKDCENRDVKGLYAKARAGMIKDFTGIDSPYETPLKPDIEIQTANISAEEAAEKVYQLLIERKIVKK